MEIIVISHNSYYCCCFCSNSFNLSVIVTNHLEHYMASSLCLSSSFNDWLLAFNSFTLLRISSPYLPKYEQ